jgi:glycine reductase complex component B subunit gamma
MAHHELQPAEGDAMSGPLRVVHYVNQFFGGIGGEEQANVGVSVQAGAVGPGRALEAALGGGARIEVTLVCGDNFASDHAGDAARAIGAELDRLKPDLLVAGPAFASGRYGLACALACRTARHRGIAAITAMHPDNPGVSSARRELTIVPTGTATTSMPAALAALAPLALRLGRGERLGPAEVEGYIGSGVRRVYDRGRPGYQRALDMLLDKLHGRPYRSEVPYAAPERVTPAPPIGDLSRARIAMVTTGGLVRKGNPDKQVSANAVRYHRHAVAELESLSPREWEAYHAGYFNHIVNSNPNYILPLSFLRDLERQGRIGKVHENIYALPGVSTPVAVSMGHGRSIAEDLKSAGVEGALLVAT